MSVVNVLYSEAQTAAEELGVDVEAGEEFVDSNGDPMDIDSGGGSEVDSVSERSIQDDSETATTDTDEEIIGAKSGASARKTRTGAKKARGGAQSTHTKGSQKQSPALQWPWATGVTATGERIMAYRKHGRGYRCVVETEEGDPVFTIRSGSECGLLELQQYLKLRGTKQLPSADKKRKWTKEYRNDFRELLWVAVAPRKSHNPFSKSGGFRAPELWCGARWSWGLEELTSSELRRVISSGSTDGRIQRLCEQNGHPLPWETDNQMRMQIKVENDLGGSTKLPNIKAESSYRKRQDAGNGSLEALLSQMNDRMATMEKRVSQVDELTTLLKEARLQAGKS